MKHVAPTRWRFNAVDAWVCAIVGLSIICGRALYCSGHDFRQCMRDGLPGVLGVVFQAGVLVLAVWAGSTFGQRLGSTAWGLACGTAVFSVLSGVLAWLGFMPGLQ
jgi:hypothetical protein